MNTEKLTEILRDVENGKLDSTVAFDRILEMHKSRSQNMKAEQILEKHSGLKITEIFNSQPLKMGHYTIDARNSKVTCDQALMAMDDYAQQYKEALIKICEEKDKAMTTQDLFTVLQEIEKARNVLAAGC